MNLRELRDNPELWATLEERAQALALQQIEDEREQGDEVITFRLGDGGFSVPAVFVREVQPLESWTPLPMTPAFIAGLVNIRGKILTALDVRPLLDMSTQPPHADSFLIILHVQGAEMALLADSVAEVRRGDSELAASLSAVAGHGVAWVLGLDRSLNLVLDPPQLLADPRVIVNDETL
jgi:purine-binding chemotaxis protein CheW